MTGFGNLRLAFDDEAGEAMPDALPPEEKRADPVVFARSLTVPAGWPWEQARAADLEARFGAPAPIKDLMLQVRRLAPWRPREAGRFAAFYVRAAEVEGRLETTVTVDGSARRVRFEAPATRTVAVRQWALKTVAVAGLIGILAWAVGAALVARGAAEARLQALEQRVDVQLRRAEQARLLAAEDQALQTATAGDDMRGPLRDLAWVMAARRPDARIDAWHWDHGLTALEVRGPDAPFAASDREVRRAPRPLRKNTWLWAVGPGSAGGRP